jgi:hypothetical protein
MRLRNTLRHETPIGRFDSAPDMGRNKTALQNQRIANRDQRRAEVAQLIKEGVPVNDIAARLNVTRQTIHADLCDLHAKWLRQAAASYSEAKVRALLQLHQIEDEAMSAWDRSTKPAITEMTETVDRGEAGNATKTRRTVQYKVGDAKYLDTILKCIAERYKILGLYADARTMPAGNGSRTPPQIRAMFDQLTDEEREAMKAPLQKYRQLTRRLGFDN